LERAPREKRVPGIWLGMEREHRIRVRARVHDVHVPGHSDVERGREKGTILNSRRRV